MEIPRFEDQTHTDDTTYTDEDISLFCASTGDTNSIHSPTFMEDLGKRPIVPGLQIGLHALMAAMGDEQPITEGINLPGTINLVFGRPISSGAHVVFTCYSGEENGNKYIEAYKISPEQKPLPILSMNEKRSSIDFACTELQPRRADVVLPFNQLYEFTDTIDGRIDGRIGDATILAYAIGRSSAAMLTYLTSTDEPHAAAMAAAMREDRYPIFRSIRIDVDRKAAERLDQSRDLSFSINVTYRQGACIARLQCDQRTGPLYSMKAIGALMPEKDIIAFADNLPGV